MYFSKILLSIYTFYVVLFGFSGFFDFLSFLGVQGNTWCVSGFQRVWKFHPFRSQNLVCAVDGSTVLPPGDGPGLGLEMDLNTVKRTIAIELLPKRRM